ncbi:MAG: Anaerobic ribonucleoside-triphosphate reductase activating protein [Petrotoga mobilis]|uniref:Uncharacterized protein n=1 Tax=Petrotoga sibirica TaxID=156202 RepID=A0A4R8F4D9_9BACT|nr:MAG: Anaerobic ribonucleoside-triphosphate reductase activating protein [Petrotoga mobilis]TDX17437.1 hypothetical protein C8D74_101157 [Petrotoga sibirica]
MTTKDELQEMKSIIPDDLKYSNWMYNEYRWEAFAAVCKLYFFTVLCKKL